MDDNTGDHDADRPRAGPGTAAAVVVGAVLWLALVPHSDPQHADAREPVFWWLTMLAAVVLPLLARREPAAPLGLALGVPQVVLAFGTAPRGDEDGLWVLWIPFLVAFTGLLAAIAAATRQVDSRIRKG